MVGFTSKPKIKRTQPSTVFGEIPGVPVGSTFENRLFLHHSSVHSGILAGISGRKQWGCYSVVLSGGYEDDKDEGYRFTYTGCGGRDRKNGEKPREGPQTCDQSWANSRNMSLKVSAQTQKPVRVIRGYNSKSDFAPVRGYRYDGLYLVERAWMDVGKSGFKVCKYSMKRLPGQRPIPRRQGTLNLDLSRWVSPRHFGKDSESSSSRSVSPVSRAREPMTADGRPLIRRPRSPGADDEEDDEDEDEDVEMSDVEALTPTSGPSTSHDHSNPRPAVPSRQATTPEPILPTTNARSGSRRPPVSQPQAPAQAPQPDVHALLAEWASSSLTVSTPATPMSTQAPPRAFPTAGRAAPGQTRPAGEVPLSDLQPGAQAMRRQRASGGEGEGEADAGADAKRVRFH
ncbi:PUA-like domain-containing protein [Trametes elegans]|nr:PUA-like domain-containing protein [Trametes elegans]